ncbi:hypothetical protein AXG93_2190s1200 [Marchantia polymorpha subsp. ruderalis]|uniref:Uncharacterized protein n=1 Tax=Marchantia polymorpha subsp. ruderalis TaxID=1480154 RepID=A0A176WGE7_MARPO|nr:hypothetical protein AXG93_2190s1200 [Marchantia polymorpha subsp. ruderalis]
MPSCHVSLGTVDFDYGEGPSAEEPKTTEFSVADLLSDKIVPLVKYLDEKMMKYSMLESATSYVQLVCRRIKAKVTTTAKRELECKGLRVDICNAQKLTLDLRDILKVYRGAFEVESHRVEELTATLVARDPSWTAELARWMQKLADCEAAQTLELERARGLEADCNRLRSQLSEIEKHLVAAQAKLVETKMTIQQLEQETDAGLRARVARYLRGYVNWEIQTTK